MLEAVDQVAQEREPAPALYRMLVGALRTLDETPSPVVTPGFFWKLLSLEGYHPHLDGCVRCGDESGPFVAFDLADGGVLCADVRTPRRTPGRSRGAGVPRPVGRWGAASRDGRAARRRSTCTRSNGSGSPRSSTTPSAASAPPASSDCHSADPRPPAATSIADGSPRVIVRNRRRGGRSGGVRLGLDSDPGGRFT